MNDEIVVEVHDTKPPDPDEGFTRAEVLERTVVAGGVIAAGGVLVTGLPRLAAAAPSRTQDVEVLNFALLLESLQATFYAEALRVGGLTGERRQFAEVVGGQERAHRAYLRRTLGSRARSVPRFRVAQAVGGDERGSSPPRRRSRTWGSRPTTGRRRTSPGPRCAPRRG